MLVVDFGDLLADTSAVLERIYEFLGISPYPDANIEGFYRRTGLDAHGGLTRGSHPADPRLLLTDREIRTLRDIRDMPDWRLGPRVLAALPLLMVRRLRALLPRSAPDSGG